MFSGSIFFALVALGSACIGAASGLVVFDIIAAGSILWAWVVYTYCEEGGEE